jgi:2-dehydro-3-deoxyphosphogalactonate aldolase
MNFDDAVAKIPLVAILRGIKPDECLDVSAALIDSGILAIEVPLNSPQPFESIRLMSSRFSGTAAIGAGTVLHPDEVSGVRDAGGRFIVSPNTNVDVIRAAVKAELTPVPGIATATEAFAALDAGASCLKLFPAEIFGPGYVEALQAVLPLHSSVYAVGGVNDGNMGEWLAAGVAGFGIGSSLYKPGRSAADVRTRAQGLVRQFEEQRQQSR